MRSLNKREKVDGAYRVLDLRSPLLYYFSYTPTLVQSDPKRPFRSSFFFPLVFLFSS